MPEPFDKAALRSEATRRRAQARAANPLAGLTAAARLPTGVIAPGALVAGYSPFRTEIDPGPLLTRLERLGARVALPVTPAAGEAETLAFRFRDGPLVSGRYGVSEPGPECEACRPDVLIVPLLAFDRRGGRLGYGGGWYDRTLARLRADGDVLAIGLAYAAQEVPAVVVDANDQPLDGLLTERGYMPVRKDL